MHKKNLQWTEIEVWLAYEVCGHLLCLFKAKVIVVTDMSNWYIYIEITVLNSVPPTSSLFKLENPHTVLMGILGYVINAVITCDTW